MYDKFLDNDWHIDIQFDEDDDAHACDGPGATR